MGQDSNSTPDVGTVLADENFKSLPLGEKHKVLMRIDPNYSGLPPREQAHALTVIQYGPEPKAPEDLGGGSAVLRGIYGVGRGLNNAVEATYQTIMHPINTASAIATQVEQFPGKISAAMKEPGAVNKAADIGAAVPVFGPLGKQLGDRAAQGDVAGAITEGVSTAAAPSAVKEAARAFPSNAISRATIEAPEKINLPGGFKINRNVPPPPTPPEEVVYQRTKTITEAQEAAQTEQAKRTAASTKETTAQAKARDAAYQKDAEERMAIQRRADEATEARVQAEKEAKNTRLKAEQTHEKNLADAEKARQAEITAQAKVRDIQAQMDAADKAKETKSLESLQSQIKQAEKEANDAAAQKERLKTMHGDDLMRRGKEQAALDAAAKKANDTEAAAQTELRASEEKAAKSGNTRRPTVSEKFLTTLIKKNILSPGEFQTLQQELGENAVPRRGESHATWQSRVLGLVRSARAARGMADIPSGPSMMPPPPSP